MTQRKVKVGIVGCGVVATAYYLPYMMKMESVELTAVCDLYPDRTEACMRLFGAKSQYTDYYDMLDKADLEAVLILTGPGTHVPFTLAAVEKGLHVLLQKPMSTDMDGARAIQKAVRAKGVVALIEPSSNSPLDPLYPELRRLVKAGALGDPYWFSHVETGPSQAPHPALAGNPYGVGAFYAPDSGGMLFDYPYGPSEIVAVLGACKSVSGAAKISKPDRYVVPDSEYNKFMREATDPNDANYWDVVLDLPKTQYVKMGAPDNVWCTYEMVDGWIGVFHVGRLFQPVLPGIDGGGLRVYGTEGNIIRGLGHRASIISSKTELLPTVSEDGWYHIPSTATGAAPWPQPAPGSFNYYHESAQHFIDCILQEKDPVVNVEWGIHINEMMYGALESARTGQRYEMTTTVDW
ncbi:MAG: Gfo/Idh/MocA family oxidoreductase [Chloroflexota bacterium]